MALKEYVQMFLNQVSQFIANHPFKSGKGETGNLSLLTVLFVHMIGLCVWDFLDDRRTVDDEYFGEAVSHLNPCRRYPVIIHLCYLILELDIKHIFENSQSCLSLTKIIARVSFQNKSFKDVGFLFPVNVHLGYLLCLMKARWPSYSLLMGKNNHKLTPQLTLVV